MHDRKQDPPGDEAGIGSDYPLTDDAATGGARAAGGDEPTGAIVVTTFLTAVILLSWFGVLALLILRG